MHHVSGQLCEINQACTALFDRWCERRNVIGLTYLMSAWPLLAENSAVVRRLLMCLTELRKYHTDCLFDEELGLVDAAIDKVAARLSLSEC